MGITSSVFIHDQPDYMKNYHCTQFRFKVVDDYYICLCGDKIIINQISQKTKGFLQATSETIAKEFFEGLCVALRQRLECPMTLSPRRESRFITVKKFTTKKHLFRSKVTTTTMYKLYY